jgi:hypothetical protein
MSMVRVLSLIHDDVSDRVYISNINSPAIGRVGDTMREVAATEWYSVVHIPLSAT